MPININFPQSLRKPKALDAIQRQYPSFAKGEKLPHFDQLARVPTQTLTGTISGFRVLESFGTMRLFGLNAPCDVSLVLGETAKGTKNVFLVSNHPAFAKIQGAIGRKAEAIGSAAKLVVNGSKPMNFRAFQPSVLSMICCEDIALATYQWFMMMRHLHAGAALPSWRNAPINLAPEWTEQGFTLGAPEMVEENKWVCPLVFQATTHLWVKLGHFEPNASRSLKALPWTFVGIDTVKPPSPKVDGLCEALYADPASVLNPQAWSEMADRMSGSTTKPRFSTAKFGSNSSRLA